MVQSPRQNLEIKVRPANLSWAKETVLRLGARPLPVEIQIDTYFRAPVGRLKLREILGDRSVLIYYDRPGDDEVLTSSYYLLSVADPALLKTMLAGALGIRGVVRKRREIYLWHNVRIHLDLVDGLGSLLELEAVLSADHGEEVSGKRLAVLRRELKIRPEDCVSASNVDLLGL
jgi:predicted adenylyl cyclase CyaB